VSPFKVRASFSADRQLEYLNKTKASYAL